MRSLLVLLVACGDNTERPQDGPSPVFDVAIDAPTLGPCANPISGTAVTTRQLGGIHIDGGAMLVTAPTGDPRLFVVGKQGRLEIIEPNETLRPEPFLDLAVDTGGPVTSQGEAGLLGLAFHPRYHQNRQFYVFYTRRVPADTVNEFRDVVARCHRDATNPNKAEPTCTEILVILDPRSNHNGGMIEFGPDGYLYISTGDGGPQNDPAGNGQAINDGDPLPQTIALLGKMLRIDVDHGSPYSIPPDNPFAKGGGAPEIFMRGFRNPWRWSFDRGTGDLWVGDVGQNTVEELHYVKAGTGAGKNFGWDTWDGTTCFSLRTPATSVCDTAGFEFPVDERTHKAISEGGDGFNAIIGGQVYRGTCYPDLVGTYFYTDNGRDGLSTARLNPDGATITKTDLPGTFASRPASIHASASGELYLTTSTGNIFHIEAGP